MKKRGLALVLALLMVFQVYVPAVKASDALLKEYFVGTEQVFTGTADSRYEISADAAADSGDSEILSEVGNLNSFSFTVKFKTTSTGLASLMAINNTVHTNNYVSFYINNGNRLGFEIRKDGLNTHKYVDVERFTDNSWHTVTYVVAENEYYRIYLDQEMVYELTTSSTVFMETLGWETTSITFGGAKRIGSNASNYLYTGSIKDARIYNSALSEEQVMEEHKKVEYDEPILVYGKSIFDGTADRIVTENQDASEVSALTQGTFSMAYRLSDTAAASNNGFYGLFSLSNKEQESSYGTIYLNLQSRKLGFETRNGSAGTSSSTFTKDTAWHTATIVFDGTNATFYLDGVNAGSVSSSTVLKGSSWTANAVSVGGMQRTRADGKWPFNGTIENTYVFNTALTAEQVAQLHDDTCPVDMNGYEIQDITVQNIADVSAGSEKPASGNDGPAEFAIDGNTSTVWHSNYNADNGKIEKFWIDFELKTETLVNGFRVLPRVQGGNGVITAYEVLVSTDGTNYTKIGSGRWNNDSNGSNTWKAVEFDPVKTKHVRIVATATEGGAANRFVAVPELRITVPAASTNTYHTFLGGSLRMTGYSDYEKTAMRFGYDIKDVEGMNVSTWKWSWGVKNADGTINWRREVGAPSGQATPNWTSDSKYGERVSNLVITDIPRDAFTQDVCSQLAITYSDSVDAAKTHTVFTTIEERSVNTVAASIVADTTAKQADIDYANAILGN